MEHGGALAEIREHICNNSHAVLIRNQNINKALLITWPCPSTRYPSREEPPVAPVANRSAARSACALDPTLGGAAALLPANQAQSASHVNKLIKKLE